MNIQTIPRDNLVVRKAFIPKLDALLFFDYPNIEAKLLAFYLAEIGFPSMAEAFRKGLDLHMLTGASIISKDYDELTELYNNGDKEADHVRQVGKKLNFSIIYGGGIPTIMKQLNISAEEALFTLKRYHQTWPGIGWSKRNGSPKPGTLQDWVNIKLEEVGYVKTLWGRHLHPRAPHVGINALCQGCAADLMKWALVSAHKVLSGYESHLVNVVHDELQIDAKRSEIEELVVKIPDAMTFERINSVVPIKPTPDISFGSWADKKPYENVCN